MSAALAGRSWLRSEVLPVALPMHSAWGMLFVLLPPALPPLCRPLKIPHQHVLGGSGFFFFFKP